MPGGPAGGAGVVEVEVVPEISREEETAPVPEAARQSLYRLEADAVIVATGSEPLHPSFFDFSQPAVMDSTELLTIERILRRCSSWAGAPSVVSSPAFR